MEDLLTKLTELDDLQNDSVLHSIEIMGDGGWKLKAMPMTLKKSYCKKEIIGQGIQAAREQMLTWKHEYKAQKI